MSEYTKEIIDYIDDNITAGDSKEFIININNDKELKDEFLLIKDLNEYMKGKLLSGNIENDDNYLLIEQEAKDDVNDFLLQDKTDKEISDYLSSAFPERDKTVKNEIKKAEKEAQISNIDEIAKEWVSEFNKDEKKELKLLRLISNTSSDRDKFLQGSSETKFRNNLNIKKVAGRKRLYFWAASVAAIFILIFLLNNVFDNTLECEKIFAEFHEKPYELIGIQVRNAEQEINTIFEEASELYKQSSFAPAFVKFQKLATEDITFVQALFYSGLALFEDGNYKESTQIFIQVISEFDEYEIESKWYLSLTYVKNNEFNKAIPFLEDISRQKSLYQEDAKEILEQIKN